MKIIKKGRRDYLYSKNIIRFNCHDCGCIFEADSTEYTSVLKDGTYYAICHCPCCDKRLSKFNVEKTIENWDNTSQKVQGSQSEYRNGIRFEKRGLW